MKTKHPTVLFPESAPILEIAGHRIRGVRTDDVEDLFWLLSDPDVTKYTSLCAKDGEDVAGWIEIYLSSFQKQRGIYWIIETEGSKRVVGRIHLMNLSKVDLKAEIGYYLEKDQWGKGITSSAVQEVIDYAFREMRLNRIEATTVSENTPSIRVLEKAGFQREGVMREASLKNGHLLDVYCFSILRSDWVTGGRHRSVNTS